MMTPLDLSKVLVGGLLLSAHSAAAQQWWQVDNNRGGSLPCVDPASLGPNDPTDLMMPVTSSELRRQSLTVAKKGTSMYLSEPTLQSSEDAEILSICKADASEVLKSLVIKGACHQWYAGDGYMVEATVTIPCSKEGLAKLPDGISLNRSILTQAHKPLPVEGKPQGFQVESVMGTTEAMPKSQEDFCKYADEHLEGGYFMMKDLDKDENLLVAVKAAASQYYQKQASEAFNNAVTICEASEEDFVNSVNITSACKAVVAGSIYNAQFTAAIPCSGENASKLPAGFLLKQAFVTKVFVPLPYTNKKPEVQYIKNNGGVIG